MKTPVSFSEVERDTRLAEWSAATEINAAALDSAQRAVIFAALTFLAFAGPKVIALRRMVAYLLSHCGLGLNSTIVGAVVGTTDRAVRKGREFAPGEFWKRLQKARRGHAPPKLRREQVGLVARYIAEHKKCSVAELLGFIKAELGVEIDRLTLRRFLKRYGLGHLREDSVGGDTPLLSGVQAMGARSPS